jgi:hypothetical protein
LSIISEARRSALPVAANAGCSTDQVKAVTGHRSLAEVARYTQSAISNASRGKR